MWRSLNVTGVTDDRRAGDLLVKIVGRVCGTGSAEDWGREIKEVLALIAEVRRETREDDAGMICKICRKDGLHDLQYNKFGGHWWHSDSGVSCDASWIHDKLAAESAPAGHSAGQICGRAG